jgi:hypothetical protein
VTDPPVRTREQLEMDRAKAIGLFRKEKIGKGKPNKIIEPYAVGAVIDLGYCLDLVSTTGIGGRLRWLQKIHGGVRCRDAREQGGIDLL